jgi:uncharacterized MAPEG superfamily protein
MLLITQNIGANMILEMKLVLVYALSVFFMLFVQSYLTTRQYGIRPLVEYKEHITLTGIAGRADRAVKNSLVSLILLLPAAVALASTEYTSAETILALQIFLCVRIFYFAAYLFSVTWVRSCLWWLGTFCIFYLYAVALGSV